MAMALMNLAACLFAGFTTAETVTLDWNITWVTRNPDGMMERPVIGINNEWPLPQLNFTRGDNVIVNMHNQVRDTVTWRETRTDVSQLGNETASLHFHGLYQNGTNEMDGPPGVTQCDVPSGHSMTYNFTVC